MGGRRWTKEEEEKLMEVWTRWDTEVIAEKFNRSYDAIICKTMQMKLGNKMLASDSISRREVENILKLYETTVINLFKKYPIKMKKKEGKKPRYIIKIDDFIQWLKDHQEIWDSRKVELYALGVEPEWLVEKRKMDAKGFKPKREKAPRYRKFILDDNAVKEIKKKRAKGYTYKQLMQEYFVSCQTIRRCLQGKAG